MGLEFPKESDHEAAGCKDVRVRNVDDMKRTLAAEMIQLQSGGKIKEEMNAAKRRNRRNECVETVKVDGTC